ncbi:MAG: hypothetical protein WCA40_06085, partial [Candidatus Acidiferrum sp.]
MKWLPTPSAFIWRVSARSFEEHLRIRASVQQNLAMGRKPQSVRGKYDETFQELKRRALADDYEGFWEVVHDYEHKRFKETAKTIAIWIFILVAAWY